MREDEGSIMKKFWIIFPLLLIILIAASFGGYVLAYNKKIYPRVKIAEIDIGGKTPAQAREVLSPKIKAVEEGEIEAKLEEKSWKIKTEDLGLFYDLEKTVASAYRVGRRENFGKSLLEQLRAIFLPTEIAPVYKIDENKLADWLESIALTTDVPFQDATVRVKNGKATIITGKEGKALNREKLKREIGESLDKLELKPLEILVEVTSPQISPEEAEKFKDKAIELTKEKLVLVHRRGKAELSPNTLGGWIKLVKDKGTITLTFSEEKIKDYLDNLGQEVNLPPLDAKFSFSDGKVSVFQSSKEGEVLDKEEATKLIVETLLSSERELNLPFKKEAPAISEEVAQNIAKYGIKELVGEGKTSFAKSPPNRRHNIANGAKILNGILIKPGEEFSTLKYLGQIDDKTGFLPELVIKEDRTVPEFGGGLCQVSTTLFRTMLNSGLKITERQNHSYRVSYYEPPVGMDATIYLPKPDLKFVNDTPGYILIQSKVEGNFLSFSFYGTKDGRQVSMTTPQMYDVTPPGEPIYVEDPSLAPGEVKQIEKPHSGAKAVFTYTVTRGGETINKQTFRSSYVPWPARFLKGPDLPPESQETPPAETPPSQ